MAFTGIHDRANGRKQVTPPRGTKPVGDLPKYRAHANGLLARVIRGWNGGVIQKQEQVVPNLGIAFCRRLPWGLVG